MEPCFALVTGASSGIGFHYATQLARDYHYNLLLVSNQEKELQIVASQLSEAYGVRAIPYFCDLGQENAAEQVHAFCEERQIIVEVLVNNAGILIFDAFNHAPIEKTETLLMLHVVTATKLCRLFAPAMCERGKGYILNMSSMSAWMAMPSIACYNASKSYVLNFSRALWYEMKPHGVHVLAVTPGSTDTGLLPFGRRMGKILKTVDITMPPEKLAQAALHSLFHSDNKQCMPGAWNNLIVPVINHLPDWLVFTVMHRMKMFQQ